MASSQRAASSSDLRVRAAHQSHRLSNLPRPLPGVPGDDTPFWTASGDIIFRTVQGAFNLVYRMKEDGSGRQKVAPSPVIRLLSVSPDERWAVAWVPASGEEVSGAVIAYPLAGGEPMRICEECNLRWSRDGKFLYASFRGMGGAGRTFVVPVAPEKAFPAIPAAGLTEKDLAARPGTRVIERADFSPGPDPSMYAFSRESVQRNLYRIPLP